MSQINQRHNVLLVGDSTGDAQMANGIHFKEIIRIGYLNTKVAERLEDYLTRFDIVVIGDGSLHPVQLILDFVCSKKCE